MRAKNYVIGIAAVLATAFLTNLAVHKFQKSGQLDVITAQSMDMSAMRPPVGAAPVALAAARTGTINNGLVYTGTVVAYNEQIISPRITGSIVSLPVYPGDNVNPGQLLVQLDSAEVGAKASEAADNALQAQQTAQVALLTHHLHHQAALDQASATREAAAEGVTEAKSEESAAEASVTDADADVASTESSATYWKTEIAREQKLAAAGAVSQQELSNEQAQAGAATAAVAAAKAKVVEAQQSENSAKAKVVEAMRNADAADAGARMAVADLTVAEAQINQTLAGAASAKDSLNEANVVEGYTRIVSPTSGVVTERPVSAGTLVQPGQEILKIEEIDKVRVQANVAVSDLNGIMIGSPVVIQTQDGTAAKSFQSKVSAIFPAANSETRTAVVEAILPNPGRTLLPGAFVTMKLSQAQQTPGLVVPTSSIITTGSVSTLWSAVGTDSHGTDTGYVCSVCHMHYTAQQAAKQHYRDPMDGGYLLPVSQVATGPYTAKQVPVTVVASNGKLTEIAEGALEPGTEVVAQGYADLTDGARLISTPWSDSGPTSLPTNALAGAGQHLYRCEKCGMTYSEADAKKNNFVDPMDGGKLLPVKGS